MFVFIFVTIKRLLSEHKVEIYIGKDINVCCYICFRTAKDGIVTLELRAI